MCVGGWGGGGRGGGEEEGKGKEEEGKEEEEGRRKKREGEGKDKGREYKINLKCSEPEWANHKPITSQLISARNHTYKCWTYISCGRCT